MVAPTLGRMPVLDMKTVNTACFVARAFLLVHPSKLRDLEPSPCARVQLDWPTFDGAPRKPLTGARITFWILQLLAEPHAAGACYHVSLLRSRATGDHCKFCKYAL